MKTRPALLVLMLALVAPPRAPAQPPAPATPPASKDAQRHPCAMEMWSCIATCIEGKCLQSCTAPCAGAIRGLRSCLRKARCTRGDTACWRKACPEACGRVFAAVKGKPGAEPPARCSPHPTSRFEVPQEWVGSWELTSATFVRESRESDDQLVRADYGLRMHIASPDCFELETRLGGATLGAGNSLTLRVWGQITLLGGNEWEAWATGGSLTGQLCGEPRDVTFPSVVGRSVAHVRCEVDGGLLQLSNLGPSKRQSTFERVKK